MNRRTILPLVVVLVAGFLVASQQSAYAAGTLKVVASSAAVQAPNSAGNHKVLVKATCSGSTTCKGYATIAGQRTFYKWPYAIAAGRTSYLTVYWLSGQDDPTGVGNAGLKRSLRVYPTGGKISDHPLTLEKRVVSHDVVGSVSGPTSGLSDLKVSLWRYSGLTSERIRTVDVSGSSYNLGAVALGTNNENSAAYKMSVSAVVDGVRREWFWRGDSTGNSGDSAGGGKTLAEGTGVVVRKYADFKANIVHTTVSGTLSGAGEREVRAFGTPRVRPTAASDLRGMDEPGCANLFAETTSSSSGAYSLRFLPSASSSYPRYTIGYSGKGDSAAGFIAGSGTQYSSCSAVLQYTYADGDDDLIDVTSTTTVNANVGVGERRMQVRKSGSGSLAAQDTYTSLRHYVPGTKILDAPLVTATHSSSAGYSGFTGLRPGKYWVERGRRVGCAAWYPSVYKDNYAYHQGDRASERWKTVNGSKHEYWTSVVNGFPQAGRTPPSGYKGWMYRDACRTIGTGDYELVNVMNTDALDVTMANRRGATISGKVSRSGGRTNKEMLVSVYSTGGILVMRSAYTSSSGSFVIRGLPSGNYRVGVNLDSWRGIGRTFSGPKTKRVTAGKSYSVGTLKFSG